MQFELILNILFSLLCLYGLIVLKIWSLRIYTIIILIVCLLSIIALVAFSKKINQLTNTLLPVKKNLEEVYAIMKAFVKRYFQFVMSLIPFTFVLTFSLGYYQGKTSDVPAFDSLAKSFTHLNYLIIATIVYVAAVTIGAYYFTKWYLRKLYGKYMDELKALLAELEE